MKLEDFLRQRLTVDGHPQIRLVKTRDGYWQASMQRPARDGNAYTCETHEDPVDALWNVVSPIKRPSKIAGPTWSHHKDGFDQTDPLAETSAPTRQIDLMHDLKDLLG